MSQWQPITKHEDWDLVMTICLRKRRAAFVTGVITGIGIAAITFLLAVWT